MPRSGERGGVRRSRGLPGFAVRVTFRTPPARTPARPVLAHAGHVRGHFDDAVLLP
jgi:hypothetical protein